MAPEVSARIDRDAPIPRFTRAHPDRFLHPTAGTPGYPHRKIPRLTPRPFSVLAPRRHVVLPPDIAKLLPKGRLLSEVGYRSPRSGRDPPRPSFSDGGCELEIQRFPSRCTRATFGCERWFFKAFPPPDSPPPRALHSSSGARSLTIRSPFVHQAEWRGLGVQQSRGWVHYAIHRPEPHIMLYRCVRRPCPHAAVGFASFARVFFKPIGATRVRRGVLTAPADRIGPAMTSSHPRVPLGDPRLARRAESLAPRPTTRSTLFHIDTDIPYRTHRQAHAELRPAGSHRRRQQGQPAVNSRASRRVNRGAVCTRRGRRGWGGSEGEQTPTTAAAIVTVARRREGSTLTSGRRATTRGDPRASEAGSVDGTRR